MCTTSGQAATLLSILNICNAGDSFISTTEIYGGSVNLFSFTLKKLGIECIYIDKNASDDELDKAFKPNTKAVFGETLANPALTVFDIERFANIAHRHNVPLIVDNTFATPILCKPFEYGADIVIHSTSKYMDGHAVQIGGAIVDSGNFDWTNGNFPDLTEPVNPITAFPIQRHTEKRHISLKRECSLCVILAFIRPLIPHFY